MLRRLQLKRKYQNNIAFRYLSIATIFLLVVQLIIGGIQSKRHYRRSLTRLSTKVNTYGDFLARASRNPFLGGDVATLSDLASYTTQEQDIIYSLFVRNTSEVLAFELEQSSVREQLQKNKLNPSYSQQLLTTLQKDPSIIEISKLVTVGDRTIGEIRLGYSTTSVERAFAMSLLLNLGYGLLVSILFATLTLFIFRSQILLPLRHIQQVATEFAAGNLERRIRLSREDEIGELAKALNSMAFQLQHSLSNLKEVMDEALIAEQAKGQFLGRMSHELKTPLNGIIGFTQLMQQDSETTTEQQENLDIIQQSSLHLLELINNVLEITQIESGQLDLDYRVFDVFALLDSLEQMFRFKAQEKKLQLSFAIDASVPQTVESDEEKLRKVIASLLDNAIKFTSQGNITVTVKKKQSDSADALLYFKISDTGKGISPQEIDSLFVTFARTEDAAKTIDGMGLGLPNSKQLVELMRGELSIKSKEGKGTTVRFSIPINEIATTGINAVYTDYFGNAEFPSDSESVESQFFYNPGSSHQLTEQKLAVMSQEWLMELQQAAISVDNELIFEVLNRIPNQDLELQQALKDLIENFRYDLILESIDKALARKNS